MSVPMAFIGVIIIWSTTPLAIKWSREGTGFLAGVSARMLIGVALCLLILLLMRVKLPLHRAALRTYFAAGAGLYGAMTSAYWGAQFIPSGMISVLFGLTPVVTGILAAILLSENSLGLNKVGGMLVGLVGLVVVFGSDGLSGDEAIFGVFAMLLSVIVHSVSAVMVKHIGAHLSGVVTTTGALLVAVPAYIITWLIFDGDVPVDVPERTMASIIYLGVFGSALGFALYFYVLREVDVSRVALIPLVTPVIALMMGYWFNDEMLDASALLGSGLILSGLVFYQWGGQLMLRLKLASVRRK